MGCPNWGEYSVTTRAWPSRTTAMSADVPPMSRLMTWSRPSSRASSWATTTAAAGLPDAGRTLPEMPSAAFAPAAGPDVTRRAGNRAADATVISPPPECMTASRPAKPASRRRRSRAERYAVTTGMSVALMTVVEVRSNSGRLAEQLRGVDDEARDGSSSATISWARSSWAGLT